jgi:hypothetical protein
MIPKNLNQISPNFLGFVPAFIWLLFLIAFIPNTTIIVRNVAYIFWLLVYLLFVLAISSLIKNKNDFYSLFKRYIQSFSWIATFAIAQFVLGMLHIDILIQQKWLNGLPRASGFSYEPSYLATYLIIAWSVCFYLIISKSKYLKELHIFRTIILCSLAILLSGSRMGNLFILLIPSLYIVFSARTIPTKFTLQKRALKYLFMISFIVISSLIYFSYNFDKALVYLNGLGLYGTVNHSYVYRANDQEDTFKAFKKSPFIGYSLGGLPTQIALIRGKIITTQKQAKNYEGMNIFAEVLAASGIIGFLFFAYFLFSIFKKSISFYNKYVIIDYEYCIIGRALLLGLLCELAILAMNQNILRAYLWVHIGMVNVCFFVALRSLYVAYTKQQVSQAQ